MRMMCDEVSPDASAEPKPCFNHDLETEFPVPVVRVVRSIPPPRPGSQTWIIAHQPIVRVVITSRDKNPARLGLIVDGLHPVKFRILDCYNLWPIKNETNISIAESQ